MISNNISLAFGFSLIITEWSKALVVLEFEDIGSNDNTERLHLDEATATLKAPWIPMYFIGGKTVMPFGVFEDHLIEGTLAEDLYEIDEFDATLGFAPDFCGLKISFSLYEDASIVDNLNDFNTHEYNPDHHKED